MVTQKYAIKSHLNHCCQVETIVLSQLVFAVKTVKIQLDHISPYGTSKVAMVIANAPWYKCIYIIFICYMYTCTYVSM